MLKLRNMKEGEVLEVALRRHWVVYLLIGMNFLIGVSITNIVFVFVAFNLLTIICMMVFWMFYSIFLYMEWLNHELDLFIVTNNRIVGVEQLSFLNRKVTECNLGQVQEVNSETKGFFANMLNYGTLFIQTAGNNPNLKMDFAPDTMQEARKILNIVDTYRDKHSVINLQQEPTNDSGENSI